MVVAGLGLELTSTNLEGSSGSGVGRTSSPAATLLTGVFVCAFVTSD